MSDALADHSTFFYLFSQREAESSLELGLAGGFWSNENGWVSLESATLFRVDEGLSLQRMAQMAPDVEIVFESVARKWHRDQLQRLNEKSQGSLAKPKASAAQYATYVYATVHVKVLVDPQDMSPEAAARHVADALAADPSAWVREAPDEVRIPGQGWVPIEFVDYSDEITGALVDELDAQGNIVETSTFDFSDEAGEGERSGDEASRPRSGRGGVA